MYVTNQIYSKLLVAMIHLSVWLKWNNFKFYAFMKRSADHSHLARENKKECKYAPEKLSLAISFTT